MDEHKLWAHLTVAENATLDTRVRRVAYDVLQERVGKAGASLENAERVEELKNVR